ncbi:COP9 signalosome complex subunit 8, partial [Penicillium diatomitis]
MELPPLSLTQLSTVVASNLLPSQLFEVLSQYESEAVLMSSDLTRVGSESENQQLLSAFYSSFFFAHLLTNQLSEARALTQRMPDAFRDRDATIQNCVGLLRALWQTQHDQVYQILRELPWPRDTQPLVRRYDHFFQDKTLIAVSKCYEAIRPAVAATYLGLNPQAVESGEPSVIEKFTSCGWKWDPTAKLLFPSPIVVQTGVQPTSSGFFDTMALLGNR